MELDSPTNKFFLSTNGSYSTVDVVPDYSILNENTDNDASTGDELQFNIKIPVDTDLSTVNKASLYLFLEYSYKDDESYVNLDFKDFVKFDI